MLRNAANVCTLFLPASSFLQSFGATLFEMVSGQPLFHNSYDVPTAEARERLLKWTGFKPSDYATVEMLHGKKETTPLLDLLDWVMDKSPTNRPASMVEVMGHAFFSKTSGNLREHFAVDRIRSLLDIRDVDHRPLSKVMVSYCWADTNFVLSKLCPELAPEVEDMWLDRPVKLLACS